jgi:hypothetical protein
MVDPDHWIADPAAMTSCSPMVARLLSRGTLPAGQAASVSIMPPATQPYRTAFASSGIGLLSQMETFTDISVDS